MRRYLPLSSQKVVDSLVSVVAETFAAFETFKGFAGAAGGAAGVEILSVIEFCKGGEGKSLVGDGMDGRSRC